VEYFVLLALKMLHTILLKGIEVGKVGILFRIGAWKAFVFVVFEVWSLFKFMSVVVSFSHKDRMECRCSIQFLTLENLGYLFHLKGA